MLWLILSLIVIATSPIGRALADRMAGRVPSGDPGRDAIDAMERRIGERILELEDRVDLAEQLLRRPAPPETGAPRDPLDPDQTVL